MGNLLIQVSQRLNGKGGEPVIQLQTAFGGGKTHTLMTMWHLARNIADPTIEPGAARQHRPLAVRPEQLGRSAPEVDHCLRDILDQAVDRQRPRSLHHDHHAHDHQRRADPREQRHGGQLGHAAAAGGERVTRFNALFHWAVPPGREIDAGREVGRHHIMTHAYWREGGPEFHNVNIMGVAHGTDKPLLLAHKAAIDQHLVESGIAPLYTNVFWGGAQRDQAIRDLTGRVPRLV